MGIIGLVGDEVLWPQAGDEGKRVNGVMGLAAREQEADRPAQRVDRNMPLAAQTSSGTPQSLVFAPPF